MDQPPLPHPSEEAAEPRAMYVNPGGTDAPGRGVPTVCGGEAWRSAEALGDAQVSGEGRAYGTPALPPDPTAGTRHACGVWADLLYELYRKSRLR